MKKTIITFCLVCLIGVSSFLNSSKLNASELSEEEYELVQTSMIDDLFLSTKDKEIFILKEDGTDITSSFVEQMEPLYKTSDYSTILEYVSSNSLSIMRIQQITENNRSINPYGMVTNTLRMDTTGRGGQYVKYNFVALVMYNISKSITSTHLSKNIETGRNYNHVEIDYNYYSEKRGFITNQRVIFSIRPYVKWSDNSYTYVPKYLKLEVDTMASKQPLPTAHALSTFKK